VSKYQNIEQQFRDAINTLPATETIKPAAKSINSDTQQSVLDSFSSEELLEIALNRAEDELYDLQGELRQLKEKHRQEESRLERKIIRSEAIKRNILEKMAGLMPKHAKQAIFQQ
jgi:allophanate hydrolase subunit 1